MMLIIASNSIKTNINAFMFDALIILLLTIIALKQTTQSTNGQKT